MNHDRDEGLEINNQKRQAIPPLRGYDYQIWQSLNRWISLNEGEILFLEGAEDLDVLRSGAAETVQIKDTSRSGTVTLNSKSVIDAIIHFWEHQKNNPGYTISFRFLTTSERGMEASDPFDGVRGLDYWDQCRRLDFNLSPLRLFLSTHLEMPSDLRSFVTTISDDKLREDLIKRIEWDTGQRDKAYIEELVNHKVIYYGTHNHALSYSESVRVVSQLFMHVWSVILREQNRRLTYSDFTRLFEEYSTVRIPKRALDLRTASLNMMAGVGLATPSGGQSFALVPETALQAYSLPFLGKIARRERLVADLGERLNARGLLILKGSSGMGKSTLASLIASKDERKWRRLDLRDLKPEQVKGHLLYASLEDSEQADNVDYIIDDLNFDDHPSIYERALEGFIYTVSTRGGRIVITTQGAMPERLLLTFDLPPDVMFDVPRLSEEEIGEVAINYGCPTGKKLETWQRIILGNTLGHPLLVHARIKNIATSNWPDPGMDDLFKPTGVENVRQEVRRRLQDQLPSEHARTLAYRLSIFTGYFKRNHALHLSQHPPALPSSGEAFDLLVGPWVERLEHEYHRLSPLLAGSAEQIFSEDEIKDLHKTAAYAFLTQPALTPTELNGVLFHGLMGEIGEPLLAVATAALKIEEKDWPVISREIDWFTYTALEPGERLFKTEPFVSLMLRVIQFKIAAEIDSSDKAPRVVASWEAELNTLDEYKEFPFYLSLRMIGQFLFNHVLFRYEVPIPIKTVVANIAKGIIVDRDCKLAAKSGDKIMQKILQERPEVANDFDVFVFVAAARCKQADDVAEFLDTLEALDAEAAEVFWNQLGSNESVAMNFISGAWLREIDAPSPNWPRALEVIERAAELALSKGAEALFVHAYCAKAILIREYLPERDSESALKVLDEGADKLGYDHHAFQDYRAKVYMLDGRYQDALEVWRNIPPEPETAEASTRLFTYREALMSAGKMGNWSLAAEYALTGEKIARRFMREGDIMAVGFLTEHAFALWQAGRLTDSLKAFSKIIDDLAALPDTNSNIRAYALHISIIHAIRWIEQSPEYKGNNFEPAAGDFTVPRVDEKIRNKPIPPYVFFWLYLARVEYKYGVGDSIFRRLEAEDKKQAIRLVKCQIEHLRLLYSLRKYDLTSLVNLYAVYANIVKADYSALQNVPAPPSFDTQLLVSLLFAALVKLVDISGHRNAPVGHWIADAKSNGILNHTLEAWIDLVKRSITAEEDELLDIIKDPSQTSEARPVAALFLSASKSLHPEDRFLADSILINAVHTYSLWNSEIESIIEKFITEGWAIAAAEQRFALNSPLTTAPQIIKTCQDNSIRGLQKAAKVLLTAQWAVSTRLPENIIIKLMNLAE